MKKKNLVKITSILLSAAMVSTSLPLMAFADAAVKNGEVIAADEAAVISDNAEVPSGDTAITEETDIYDETGSIEKQISSDTNIDEADINDNADIDENPSSEESEYIEGDYSVGTLDLPDNDDLFEEYLNKLIEERVDEVAPTNDPDEISNDQVSRKSKLSGNDLKAYDYLYTQFKKIADGDRTVTSINIPVSVFGAKEGYTASELGLSDMYGDNFVKAQKMLGEKIQYNTTKVVYSLLLDTPYELYWFDKTTGYFYNNPGYKVVNEVIYYDGEVSIVMAVAQAYSIGSTKTINGKNILVDTNSSKTKAASKALDKAVSVVNSYKTESDYHKLKAYKEWICNAVSYNHDAVNKSPKVYGDPWQLIYAFDDDPNTNIVCEGYSKAFKLLCDLSTFKNSKMDCYIMTGTMSGGTGAGGHMWNTMLMEDGKYYMVDVTNCDSGSVGEPNKLFLRGYSGVMDSADSSFYITCGATKIGYTYDTNTMNSFATAERTLSDKDYVSEDAANEHFTCVLNGEQEAMISNLSNPQTAWKLTKATYQPYSSNDPIPYSVRLEEMYIGDTAANIVAEENMYNDTPKSDQQWILFKFYLQNRGTKELKASDLLYYKDIYYTRSGASISPKTATFSHDRKGKGVYDLKLEGGASGYVWIGTLLDNSVGYPYLRLNNGYDTDAKQAKYVWLDTKPSNSPQPSPTPSTKYNIATDPDGKVGVTCEASAKFSKVGAMPAVSVTFDGQPLMEGIDYTLSYSNNKKYEPSSSKKPTVSIKGKGDYTGTIKKTFTITKADRSDIQVLVEDKVYKSKQKKGYFKSTPKITESGKTLKKGKEISKYKKSDIEYYYSGTDIKIPDTEVMAEYAAIDVWIHAIIPDSSPYGPSDEKYFVGTYRMIPADKTLKKAKVKANTVTYSDSNNISITADDFTVTLKNQKVDASDFKIVSVVVNAKKTSAKVTIAGVGEYGGMKKFSVKLKPVK